MSRRLPSHHACVVLAVLSLAACGERESAPAPATAPAEAAAAAGKPLRLRDVTESTGVSMVTVSGGTPSREILEVNGSGLALIDYDDDGDHDLFVANGATLESPHEGPGWRLFRNDGALRFTDVTDECLPADVRRRWGMGAAVGDVDGDGRDDLYVACWGANALLRNTGDGRFEDVAEAAGVADRRWGTSCAFGDLDGDGDLDLYVVNYVEFDPRRPPPRAYHKGVEVMNGPHNLLPLADVAYENLGDLRFRDASASFVAPPSYGLNLVILDFDGDGRQDVFVGNDSMANFLFRNVGPWAFEEIGLMSGIATNADGAPQATMGIAVGDVNEDGRPDLFTTNFANDTNTLHASVDGLWFDDRTRQYGLGLNSRPMLGWACAFADLDHDGDEDLLAFNGHVYPEATTETMDSAYEQPPMLMARAERRFRRVTAEEAGAWLAEPHRDRAAVFNDLDGDGDVDVVVSELNGPVRILANEAADERDDWLIVTLDDPARPNRRGLGSRVRVEQGAAAQTRWIHGGGPFQSAGAPEAHFGVRDGEPVSVIVTWPDGSEQRVEAVEAGRRVVVRRGE